MQEAESMDPIGPFAVSLCKEKREDGDSPEGAIEQVRGLGLHTMVTPNREENAMDLFNTISDLAKFFSVPGKGVTYEEFVAFWGNLSEDERDFYRHAELKLS